MAETAQTTAGTVQETPAEHEAFPPFDSSNFLSELLFLALAFGVLYYTLSKSVLPKFTSLLADRSARIAGDLKEAARHKAEADAAAAAYEASLAAARKASAQIASDTRDAVKADITARQKAVDAGFAAQIASAEERINANKAQALAHVNEIAAAAAAAAVSRLINADVVPGDVAAAVAAVAR